MSNNVLRAGSALAVSLALAGCLTTGGGEPAAVASADQPAPASKVQELVRCERPLGSAAVLEPDANVLASLQAVNLQSPTPVIRMMMQQSNCFRVIGESLGQPGGRQSTVKWLISPAVAFSDTSASDGGFIGNLAGNILPKGVGLGDVSVRTKEAQTSLFLTDAATGEQKAAAQGLGRSTDLGVTAAVFSRRGGAVAVAAYADTPEGKVVAASFVDSYNKLVEQVRGFAPPPPPTARRAKTARVGAPPPADQ
jgi:hypothetical protein